MAELTIQPEEIRAALDNFVSSYEPAKSVSEEVGHVTLTADGIARVEGLPGTMANELLTFEDGTLGLAMNLEEREIGVVVLGEFSGIQEGQEVRRTGDVLSVPVGEGYLGRTVEYTRTDAYVPMLEGRSSTGRLGLCIHVTAGFGDVGFAGYWTLEIFCIHPIRIYPGVGICQIYYHTIAGDYDPYRSGKYQNNTGIQPSLMYREFQP